MLLSASSVASVNWDKMPGVRVYLWHNTQGAVFSQVLSEERITHIVVVMSCQQQKTTIEQQNLSYKKNTSSFENRCPLKRKKHEQVLFFIINII